MPTAAAEDEDEDERMPPEVVAALRMVEQMSAENRLSFTEELQDRYPDNFEDDLKDASDLAVVHTIIEAIGVERTRALSKKMTGLIFKAVGRAALPDCQWCSGRGLMDVEFFGGTRKFKWECYCVRRKRGEDFEALKARLDERDAEQQIPQQDFSFGLEVTTKDGRVWASGVRLPTEEEVKFYIDYWARNELRKHAYKTWENEADCDLVRFEIKRYDEQPLMRIWGGKRKSISFLHGTCGLLGPEGWSPISGGECECKKCKESRAFWAQYEAGVARALSGDAIKDKPSEGNGVDPEQAAEFRKQEFAAMETATATVPVTKHDNNDGRETKAVPSTKDVSSTKAFSSAADNNDGLDIPECLRRRL
jgi:hypothetical protein